MSVTLAASAAAGLLRADPSAQQCVEQGSIWTDWLHPGGIGACSGPNYVGQAIQNTVLEPWVQDAKNGVADSVKTMVSFWINVPSPNVGDVNGGKSEVVSFLQGGLMPIVAITMCFVIVAGLVTVMWTQRGEGLKKIAVMLLTYIAVDSIAAGTIAVALEVTDNASKWLIDQSTQGTNFADNLFGLFNNTAGVGSAILLVALLLIASLVAAFTSLLMIARGGILLCLVGSMLLAVAMGWSTIRHFLGWIVALVLYKLAGAIVYSVGFRLLGTDTTQSGQGLLQILYGLTLLGMAVLALPAVIRLVVPAVAPSAQGRGAGAAASAVGATLVTAAIRR